MGEKAYFLLFNGKDVVKVDEDLLANTKKLLRYTFYISAALQKWQVWS
jgi:hypothetical protein